VILSLWERVLFATLMVGGLGVWVGAWLAVTVPRWEALAAMDERDRRDRFASKEAPYRPVNDDQEQIRALRRFDAALDAMDEPDEHELQRFVG